MSGGSMDYVYYHVDEAASMCEDMELAELLRDAALVLHDEEWWRSSDYSEDRYRKTLAEFKDKWFKSNRADRLKGYVDGEIDRCRKRCYSIIGTVTADDVLRGECEQVLTDCDDGLMPPFTAHCSKCGTEWGFTPKFCPECGAKVAGTRCAGKERAND